MKSDFPQGLRGRSERINGNPLSDPHPYLYGAKLTETTLLGLVALRTGERIRYDEAKVKVTNSEAADRLLRNTYRSGWELKR